MKYGLIGQTLSHSFSAPIHQALSGEEYLLKEVPQEGLEAFFSERDFCAVNVTIPYKSACLRYLDVIDSRAEAIGAVNTVVNRDGKLYGYNTDYYGLKALIEKNAVSLCGKTVLILGSGGTSLTAEKVAEDMGAARILRVSRGEKPGTIPYEEAYQKYKEAQVLINTTPVGMYPHTEGMAADIAAFTQLEAVFDVVYNPLRTDLVLASRQRGIIAEGGLFMLVAQAVFASELFFNKHYESAVLEKTYRRILAQKQNIVLTGMPGSGKSTVGKLLSACLGKEFFDTDALIEAREAKPVSAIFAEEGEAAFRKIESEVIALLSSQAEGIIIATGGGAVLREENVKALRRNGKIYFLNRALEALVPTADRPLALDRAALEQRFKERFAIYQSTADCEISVTGSAQETAALIGKEYQVES